ncbi:triose-phosphate isomerase [bacterium]|nr:triose-phosphate isomerase [bacterium]
MRKPVVCGNWKMYRTPTEARHLARDVANGLKGHDGRVEVAVCPAFPAIAAVAETLKGSAVAWGAQNCAAAPEGAFTGEVSTGMLLDLGCSFVILGHSERRQIFAETDEGVRAKLEAVLGAGLTPIVCCGETIHEREAGRTDEVVERQIRAAFEGLPGSEVSRSVVAYEPIWAIGTGETATPEQAEAVHRGIRVTLAGLHGDAVATETRILYGGSVKPNNARELFSQGNIDGGLIGGAALDAGSFLEIVRAG